MKHLTLLVAALIVITFTQAQSRIQNIDNLMRQIDPNLEKAKMAADAECKTEAGKTDPVSWYLKAYVYKEMMKSAVHKKKFSNVGDESLAAAQKCKELDPRKDLWNKLINILFDLSPLFYNDGIAAYNEATKLKPVGGKPNPKSADFYKTALYNFEKFKDVLETLDDDKEISVHLLKFHKINVHSINYFAAFCAQQINDNEKAKKYYHNAIDYTSDAETAKQKGSLLAYYYYTGLLIDEKIYSEATKILDRGLELYPESKELPSIAIELSKKTESPEEQVKIFERILQIQPNNISIYSNLATSYSKLSDKMESSGYASSAVEYRDKSAETYRKICTMTTDKKFLYTYNYNAAILYYKPATALYKENQVLNETKYKELFNKAIPFFEDAHKYEPGNKNVIEILASIYQIMQMTEKGVEMEKKLKK
ncbi:MAG: hypothetical protein A2275_12145 [Bacteroidetes bacterium RIFOXYA12_FULL_35_11]|nr:MAG: hypothetical protein A2X01_14280 [Bacteroidetes bacterium GWF2_35_48]OFY78522.1 MAG: hypothetical protein A2275_12145 [Bacteroidetes bacterium RIFOXYA12_FULL_35_11]OFZ01654.1 MAG: hypothetical protein A2491_12900 [Bacteroidetes bacterium RIFOXYC12_FULL_35_7]HBX52248.1 hypothetical protein [Bacteroidales bacterium]